MAKHCEIVISSSLLVDLMPVNNFVAVARLWAILIGVW